MAWTLARDADESAAYILDSMGAWHPEVISRAVTVLMNDRYLPLPSPSSGLREVSTDAVPRAVGSALYYPVALGH